MSKAAIDIADERRRQMVGEGHSYANDDAQTAGQLVGAALCYAARTLGDDAAREDLTPPAHWPFDAEAWKPADRRRELVKAAALLAAEIDRLDRASPPAPAEAEGARYGIPKINGGSEVSECEVWFTDLTAAKGWAQKAGGEVWDLVKAERVW